MQKPSECIGCPLYDAPGPVWGTTETLGAKLAYVAQNPGQEECFPSEGKPRPLIGPSGRVFGRQLVNISSTRSEWYITNVVKCKTPKNREPTQEEINHCDVHYKREMDRFEGKVVVLAGAVAFRKVMQGRSTFDSYYPKAGIFDRMGCVEFFEGRAYISTIHPAFVMRLPQWREAAEFHLIKAMTIAAMGELRKPVIHIYPDDKTVREHLEGSNEFAYDWEMNPPPQLRKAASELTEDDYVFDPSWEEAMFGYSARPYEAIVLEPSRVQSTREVWYNPDGWAYAHNQEYDIPPTERHVGPRTSWQVRLLDTMVAHHWLNNNVNKYLKPTVLSMYTLLPYYNRDLETVNRELYNGMDVITTLLAAREIKRRMERL